ncbi:DUF6527 family protein [Arenimonas malthae]|uniref:DUF6527 family protein n=1 Tax=Arenimonas malthae TaxID=354197 RepID=UPI003CCBBBFE
MRVDTVYVVRGHEKLKWALFFCPCRCGVVICLSLQSVHEPHWRLTTGDLGRPTLFPSVWRDQGCLSHFFVRDGRIHWALDNGTPPPSSHIRTFAP